MSRDVRAAIIGGLTATFVVAVSFAPRLVGGGDEVRVRNSATESAASESGEGGGTTAPADATTTTGETADSTAPDLATRVNQVEKRVTTVENRVSVIESTTSTTGSHVSPPLSTYPSGHVPPSSTSTTVVWPDPAVYFAGTVMEGNPVFQRVYFNVFNPRPGMTIRYLFESSAGVSEHTLRLPDTGIRPSDYSYRATDSLPFERDFTPKFRGIQGWSWDGGHKVFGPVTVTVTQDGGNAVGRVTSGDYRHLSIRVRWTDEINGPTRSGDPANQVFTMTFTDRPSTMYPMGGSTYNFEVVDMSWDSQQGYPYRP